MASSLLRFFDHITGKRRLLDRFDRLDRVLLDQSERMLMLEKRLEGATNYLAFRADRTIDSQSVYLGDHTAITFLQGGIRILVDTRSLDIGVHLLTLGRWEPQYTTLFTRLLEPGSRVLDIGANHGVYALMAAQLVGPSGRVDAFEPNPRLAKLVELSFSLNGFSNWSRIHAVGVSDKAGTARLVFNDAYSGGGAIGSGGEADSQRPGVDCRLEVLDELFAAPSYLPDLIKIDVEGHEGRALRGMMRMLTRAPNVRLMMEFVPDMMARSGVPAAEVAAMLGGIDLRPWSIGEDGTLEATSWEKILLEASRVRNILVARTEPALG